MLKLCLCTRRILVFILFFSCLHAVSIAGFQSAEKNALRGVRWFEGAEPFGKSKIGKPPHLDLGNSNFTNPAKAPDNDDSATILMVGGFSAGLLGLAAGFYGYKLFLQSEKSLNVLVKAEYGRLMCLGSAAAVFGFTFMGIGISSYFTSNS